ncbi:MAG: transglycosylase SLT domain-containing protein, partial [Sterolibacterium sp.]|nr:transglycosylase SLT domain-containing protein [Sterolibacterium sp.]
DWLMARGYSVDLGLAQVNSRHLKRFGLPASMLFDPCTNIAVGARILMENYAQASHKYADSQDALRAAISAYNTGNHTAGLSNGYVRKVATAAGRVAAQPGMAAMPLLVNR